MSYSILSLNRFIPIIIIFAISFFNCSDSVISDGGTDVFNATISGKIISNDSSSVKNSIVKLIPSNFNPLLDILEKESIDTVDSVGLFTVSTQDSGIFNLFVKSENNSHASFIKNIEVGSDSSYTINSSMDSVSIQKIILPNNIYGHGAYLGFLGTEIYQGIPNMFDTIEILLPTDTLPALQIIWPDGVLGNILIDTFIPSKNIIIVSDSTFSFNSTFIPWSNLGSPNEAPINLLKDSLGNIWTIFKSGITMFVDSGIEITKANFFDKSILLPATAALVDINDAKFDNNGNLWICSNGEGLYKHTIDINGIKSGGIHYNSANNSMLYSDTVYTIDFSDTSALLVHNVGFNIGSIENDTIYNSLAGYLNCRNAMFLSDTGILFISQALNLYSFNNKLVTPYPFNFDTSYNISSFSPITDSKIYIGTNYNFSTGNDKVAYLDFLTNNWNYYNLYVLSPATNILSTTIDLNGDEWFGTSNSRIVYLPEKNENKEVVLYDKNSSFPSNGYNVRKMITSEDNVIFAAVDTLGLLLFDVNSKN